MKSFAVFSDFHAPHQHQPSVDIALSFQRDLNPDFTVFLGDIIDGTHVSTFATDAGDFDTLDEFESGNELLDMFQPTHYVAGNHEHRFYKPGNVPQGYRRLLDPRRWLSIKKRGIKWYKYSHYKKDLLRFGDLTLVHGFACNQYAARKEASSFGSVVHGHTHRFQVLTVPHAVHKWTGYNIGCMCDLEVEYAETRSPHGWSHGFGYGYLYKSGKFSFHPVLIRGNRVMINGKEYKA